MIRVLCFLFALLLFGVPLNDYTDLSFYTCVTFQDGSCYEEYMSVNSLQILVEDFHDDVSIESIFITRDL